MSSTSSSKQAMASTIQPLKLCKNSDDDDDRISNLPEPLLLHILSFLSTKQAARTSVLSKHWQYLWTLVPDLDISDSDIDIDVDADDIDIVDLAFFRMFFKILGSRRVSSIRKLRLICYNANSDYEARSLFCAAVKQKVQELDFCWGTTVILPRGFFHCSTLVVLDLCNVYFGGSSFHFPSLKILRLGNAEYEGEATFRNLLSGCPVLDEFVMSYNVQIPVMSFHYEISSLTVRKVIILRPPPLKITVNAPALERLAIGVCAAPRVLVLNDVPRSVRANIAISSHLSKCDYRDTVKSFLGALCNVQFLELHLISGLVHDHKICKDVFPRFDYLVELKVGSDNDRCALPLVAKMLLNCPRLEHLIIASAVTDTCVKTQCWISPRHVPNCLAFHLTTIKFERFKALEAEMEFTEYVLNNSKVLRNMTISYGQDMDSKRMSDAFLRISAFEKQSTTCQLNFQQLQ